MQNRMLTNGKCDTDIDLVSVAPFLIFDRNENDREGQWIVLCNNISKVQLTKRLSEKIKLNNNKQSKTS